MSKIEGNSSYLAFCSDTVHLYSLDNEEIHQELKISDQAAFQPPEHRVVDSIALSNCGSHVALCCYKTLFLYSFSDEFKLSSTAPIDKTAVCVKFFNKRQWILVAERSGQVAFFSFRNGSLVKEQTRLGHNSMLTAALITADDNFVITSDRDEKIRVSRFPNTYNIESFCLGHERFVSSLSFLPSDSSILVSSSGDGTVRLWEYVRGRQISCFKRETEESFMKCTVCLYDSENIIAVQIYKTNEILVLSLGEKFEIRLKYTVAPVSQILDICAFNYIFYLLDDNDAVRVLDEFKNEKIEKLLGSVNRSVSGLKKFSPLENFDVFFKREFNNLEIYHERKRARIAEKAK